jgi:hypothetical protein
MHGFGVSPEIGVEEGFDDGFPEGVAEVHHVERNAEPVGHAARVLDGFERAASALRGTVGGIVL